jgi:RsiW-degrading membrane proteinase PrsW (M82 family)
MLLCFLFSFLPALGYATLIYWLDRYEKEPLALLGGAFAWGAVVAAGGALLANTLFDVSIYALTGSANLAELTTSVISAPLVEETLKGLAVLLVFVLVHSEFDSILDGIVYAAVTALGFSATENTLYIYQYGYAQNSLPGLLDLTLVRVVLLGWQHPFYTAFIGIGLAIARTNRSPVLRLGAPLAGWSLAISAHGLHNTLSTTLAAHGSLLGFLVDWSGWLAMLAFILLMQRRERTWHVQYLREEIALGHLSPAQYRTACSAPQRFAAILQAIPAGRSRQTRQFYQASSELVHKKRQLERLGEETGNSASISALRDQLTRLSPVALY